MILMKETEVSVVWNVFIKSIGWAYLGMEMACKKVKSFSERKTVVSAEIWAFSAFAKA